MSGFCLIYFVSSRARAGVRVFSSSLNRFIHKFIAQTGAGRACVGVFGGRGRAVLGRVITDYANWIAVNGAVSGSFMADRALFLGRIMRRA